MAHVKVCVLALLLSRVAELATGLTWPRVRHELRQLQAIEYESEQHGFFGRTELTREQTELLSKLEIEAPSKVLGTWPRQEQLELL